MAIPLRPGEEVKHVAEFHWCTYIGAATCATLATLVAILQIYRPEHAFRKTAFLLALFAGYYPLVSRYLKNLKKQYIVTNQRLYLEEGIFTKTIREFSYNQILDLKYSHGFVQNILGTGSVVIFTREAAPVMLDNLEQPRAFRDRMLEAMAQNGLEREREKKTKTGSKTPIQVPPRASG